MANDGYQPDFDVDLERGKVGEELLETFLADLQDGAKFEVKTDYRAWDTGNLYIETKQYRKPDQSDIKLSGINITKADWWVFAGPKGIGFTAIKTSELKALLREVKPDEAEQRIVSAKTNASKGLKLKLTDLIAKIMNP